jgi:hypothetical protein
MNRFQRATLWAALIAILLLAVLSVCGAFLGAEQARAFFNCLPLAVYWFVLIALLIAGIVLFRRLLHVPALLLMHVGSIVVLIGALWGSNGGHAIARQLFGIDKIPESVLRLHEQTPENRVRLADANGIRELPFFVRLNTYREEYYDPGQIFVWWRDGRRWSLPAEAGLTFSLDRELCTITIRRVFQNFKIDIENDQPVAYDEPGGSNPALEIGIERAGSPPGRRYIFERRPAHPNRDDPLAMSYRRAVKDYVSKLEIVNDGRVVAGKDVEVNHPLHYGGYYIYQYEPGDEDEFGVYTGLLVVSDSGLNLVYSGYAMLILGIFWHFGGRRVRSAVQNQRTVASEVVAHHE